MKPWWALVAMLAGCAKEVPVEVKTPPAEKPAECFVARERVPRVPVIPAEPQARAALCGTQSVAVCVNTLWSRHALARDAADRKAEARRRVCAAYVEKI